MSQPSQHLDLGLPASVSVRGSTFLSVKPPRPQCFVTNITSFNISVHKLFLQLPELSPPWIILLSLSQVLPLLFSWGGMGHMGGG